MAGNQFGGDWTNEKLDCLHEYLRLYRLIFTSNERARFFTTHYVDAFAGSGYRIPSGNKNPMNVPSLLEEENDVREVISYLKGSTRIALDLTSPFDQYLFLDTNPEYIQELHKMKSEYPALSTRIQIELAEANDFLIDWCHKMNWKYNRAVIFLDPYGTQVEWRLLQKLAETKAVDLWLLFPLGMGVNRLLTRDHLPSETWSNTLTRVFGTDEWQTFYRPSDQLSLFGEEQEKCKNVNLEKIGKFFIMRLKEIFCAVVEEPLQLCNSRNNPLYLLCFAAANSRGAPTALRIAKNIIERKRQR